MWIFNDYLLLFLRSTGRQKIKSKISKSEKLTTRPQKRKENLFSPMNLDPPPHKNLSFFFKKICLFD